MGAHLKDKRFGAGLTGICRMTRRTPAVRRHAGIGSPGSILQPARVQQRSGSVMREAKGSRQRAKATRHNCRGRSTARRQGRDTTSSRDLSAWTSSKAAKRKFLSARALRGGGAHRAAQAGFCCRPRRRARPRREPCGPVARTRSRSARPVDRRSDDREVEAIHRANIAIEHLAEVEREIDRGNRFPHPRSIRVKSVEAAHCFGGVAATRDETYTAASAWLRCVHTVVRC